MSVTHHIGLELGEGVFRAVEVRFQNGAPTIVGAGEYETEYNYGSHLLHDAPFREKLAKSFLTDLSHLFLRQKFFASTVSIALASHVPTIATIPVDSRLSDEEVREQLEWECNLHHGSTPVPEWKIFTQQLRESGETRSLLTVALPAQTITFLKTTLALMTLRVRVIDVDHFAVENAILRSERITRFALVGLHERYFTLSMFDDGHYTGFLTGTHDLSLQHLSPLLHALNLLLKRLPEQKLEFLYVYGISCTESIVYALQSLLRITVIPYDPLRTVPYSGRQGMEISLSPAPQNIGAAFGAALRWK